MYQTTVTLNQATQRLDRFLKKLFPSVPHSVFARLCRTGRVRLDDKRCSVDTRILEGQLLVVQDIIVQRNGKVVHRREIPCPKNLQDFYDWVIYEDENLMALNKPFGMSTQGGTKVQHHVDAYLHHLNLANKTEWKLVHRLDKDTTGVLLIAKTISAARLLTGAFKEGAIEKTYLAITQGVPRFSEGEIKAPLKKRTISGQELMVEDPDGDRALTLYCVLERAAKTAALVELMPKTGLTHQLRAHLLILGTPILGDPKYKGNKEPLENVASRLHLHAHSVKIPPIFGKKPIFIKALLPQIFKETSEQLGFTINGL